MQDVNRRNQSYSHLASGSHKTIHHENPDLALDHLWVVYPGRKSYPLDDDITVVPLGIAASGDH